MRASLLGLALLALATSCRVSGSGEGTSGPAPSARAPGSGKRTSSHAPSAHARSPRGPVPPPVQTACTADADCAVARIAVSGPEACCASCGTTPGTRKWHAALQKHCAEHAHQNCSPLACPEGPTRAVCRAGVCEATATGPDGGVAHVPVERRCLPAMVCDTWAGCAHVLGNAQDGWFVEESTRVAKGEIAAVENVCTTERCEAARVFPPEAVCPASTVPPQISPAPYRCKMDGLHCKAVARP